MYIQGQFEMKRMQRRVSACPHLIRFNTSLIKSQSAIIAEDCRRPSQSTPGLVQSQREQNCLQAAYWSKQSPVRIHSEGLKNALHSFKEDNGTKQKDYMHIFYTLIS